MKKAIALFGILAMASAGFVGAASADTYVHETDDTVVSRSIFNVRNFALSNQQEADIKKEVNIKTGSNLNLIVGEDLEEASITILGGFSENDTASNVNEYVADIKDDCGCDDEELLDVRMNDDTAVVLDEQDILNFASENKQKLEEEEEVNLLSEHNVNIVVEEDIEGQSPKTMSGGLNLTVGETGGRNFQTSFRNTARVLFNAM